MEENQTATTDPPVADTTVLMSSNEAAAPASQPSVPADPSAAASADASPVTTEASASSDQPETSLVEANKTRICVRALKAIEQDIVNVIRLLESGAEGASEAALAAMPDTSRHRDEETVPSISRAVDGRVIEGVFDGQNMVGSDGKIYTVPPNYASKSKLVEGDLLKLTITPKGSFIYKQIGPIERSRVIASLGYDVTINEYYAVTDNRRWSIIKASVTYYKGEPGDEVVLLVPKNAPSKWAAVENIIKKNPLS